MDISSFSFFLYSVCYRHHEIFVALILQERHSDALQKSVVETRV